MIFDQQGDFDDIGNTPPGRLQRSDQILKRAVNLGFEVGVGLYGKSKSLI